MSAPREKATKMPDLGKKTYKLKMQPSKEEKKSTVTCALKRAEMVEQAETRSSLSADPGRPILSKWKTCIIIKGPGGKGTIRVASSPSINIPEPITTKAIVPPIAKYCTQRPPLTSITQKTDHDFDVKQEESTVMNVEKTASFKIESNSKVDKLEKQSSVIAARRSTKIVGNTETRSSSTVSTGPIFPKWKTSIVLQNPAGANTPRVASSPKLSLPKPKNTNLNTARNTKRLISQGSTSSSITLRSARTPSYRIGMKAKELNNLSTNRLVTDCDIIRLTNLNPRERVAANNKLRVFKGLQKKLQDLQSDFFHKFENLGHTSLNEVTFSFKFVAMIQNEECRILVRDEDLFRLPKKLPLDSVADLKNAIQMIIDKCLAELLAQIKRVHNDDSDSIGFESKLEEIEIEVENQQKRLHFEVNSLLNILCSGNEKFIDNINQQKEWNGRKHFGKFEKHIYDSKRESSIELQSLERHLKSKYERDIAKKDALISELQKKLKIAEKQNENQCNKMSGDNLASTIDSNKMVKLIDDQTLYKETIHTLTKKLQMAEKENENLCTTNAELKNMSATHSYESEQLNDKLEEFKKKIPALNKKLQMAEKENERLYSELREVSSSMNTEKGKLTDGVKAYKETIHTLTKKLQMAEKENENLCTTNAELKKLSATHSYESGQLNDKLEEFKKKIPALNKKLQMAEKENERLYSELREVSSSMNNEKGKLTDGMKAHKETIQTLTKKLQIAEKENEKLRTTNTELHKASTTNNNELIELTDELKECKKNIRVLNKKLQIAENENDSLNLTLTELNMESNSYSDEKEQLTDELKEHEERIHTLTEKLQIAENENESLRTTNTDLSNMSSAYHNERVQLTDEITECKETISTLTEEIYASEQQLNVEYKEKQEMEKHIVNMEAELNNMRKRVEELLSQCQHENKYFEQIEEKQMEIDDLKNTISTMETERNDFQMQLNNAKEDYCQFLDVRQKLQTAEHQISSLQAELLELQQVQHDHSTCPLVELNELAEKREIDMRQEIKTLIHDLTKAKYSICQFEEQLQEQTSLIKNCKDNIATLKSKIKEQRTILTEQNVREEQNSKTIKELGYELQKKSDTFSNIFATLSTKHMEVARQDRMIKVLEESNMQNQKLRVQYEEKIERMRNKIRQFKQIIIVYRNRTGSIRRKSQLFVPVAPHSESTDNNANERQPKQHDDDKVKK